MGRVSYVVLPFHSRIIAMAKWEELTTSELCEQLAVPIGAAMYSSKIEELSISGESFFFIEDDYEWSFFFFTVEIKLDL